MRYAILADIHSNIHALDAVLADLATQPAVDEMIVNGDSINAGPAPRAVLERLYALNATVLMGNHEQYVLQAAETLVNENGQYRPSWQPSYWTLEQCTTADLDYVRNLPRSIVRGDVAIMHGAPDNLRGGVRHDTPDSQVSPSFLDIEQPVIITAHTHVPFMRNWRGKQLVNPGSVGMPLDDNPAASYCILNFSAESLAVEFRRVAYDVAPVKQMAEEVGLLAAGGTMSYVLLAETLHGKRYIVPFMRRVQELISQGIDEQTALDTSYAELGLTLDL
jgi:putative phosphoesterase